MNGVNLRYHYSFIQGHTFWVHRNADDGLRVVYNNAGLISKVSEEIASENVENCRCRQPLCCLIPPPQGTPRISASTLPRQKVQSEATVLPLIVWVYLHSNFCGGLRNTHLFCNRVHIGRSRSSKVVDFGTIAIERAYATSSHKYNLGLSYAVSETRRIFGWKLQIFPIPLSCNTLAWGEPFRISGWAFIARTIESLGYPSVKISWS